MLVATDRNDPRVAVWAEAKEALHARMARYQNGRDWEILDTDHHDCPNITGGPTYAVTSDPGPRPPYLGPCEGCHAERALLLATTRRAEDLGAFV